MGGLETAPPWWRFGRAAFICHVKPDDGLTFLQDRFGKKNGFLFQRRFGIADR